LKLEVLLDIRDLHYAVFVSPSDKVPSKSQ